MRSLLHPLHQWPGGLVSFCSFVMPHSSRRALLCAAALLLALALPACGRDEPKQTTSAELGSGNLKWDHFPVKLRVDDLLQAPGHAHDDLLAAAEFWENRAHKHLFDLSQNWPSGQAPFTGPSDKPAALLDNVIFFLSPWPLDPHVAGNTTLHYTDNTLDHAVIFLNTTTDLCDGDCDGPGDQLRTSRRRLLAHEMGHFLGFSHVEDQANIMFPVIQAGGRLDDRQIDQGLLDRLTTL